MKLSFVMIPVFKFSFRCKKLIDKVSIVTRKFFKVNRIVLNCNIIVRPKKLGSYTTRRVRCMRKVSFARFKNVCAVGNWCNTEVLKLKIWMKNKVFPKCILIKCIGISFQSREFSRLVFRSEILKATFFKPPFWKLLHIVSFLIFTLLEFYRNSICIRCIALVISLEISKTCAKNTNFDKPNFLKIISLPSSVSFLGRHILNFILMPIIVFLFWNSALVWNFYYAKKNS